MCAETSSTSTGTGSCGSVKKSYTTHFEGIGLEAVSEPSASNDCNGASVVEPVVVKIDASHSQQNRNGLRLDIADANRRLNGRNGLNGLKPRLPPEPANYDSSGNSSTYNDNRYKDQMI